MNSLIQKILIDSTCPDLFLCLDYKTTLVTSSSMLKTVILYFLLHTCINILVGGCCFNFHIPYDSVSYTSNKSITNMHVIAVDKCFYSSCNSKNLITYKRVDIHCLVNQIEHSVHDFSRGTFT